MPQPAFVLHRRDYQETSLLVDLLTLNDGRIRVIAKGAKRSKSTWRGLLQAFSPLQIEFSGRHELKTLTLAEATENPYPLSAQRLYSGFYLNELLQRLLPLHADVSELFVSYQAALWQLANSADMEATLRWFEWQLLNQLGVAFDWRADALTGHSIDGQPHCYFDPQQGFISHPHRADARPWSTQTIKSLAELDWQSEPMNEEQRLLSKKIMREALAQHLGDRPLRSRELFRRS